MKNFSSLGHKFELRKFHKVSIALQTFTVQMLPNFFFREKYPALFCFFTDIIKNPRTEDFFKSLF